MLPFALEPDELWSHTIVVPHDCVLTTIVLSQDCDMCYDGILMARKRAAGKPPQKQPAARGINIEIPKTLHEKLRVFAHLIRKTTIKAIVVEFLTEGLARAKRGRAKKGRKKPVAS